MTQMEHYVGRNLEDRGGMPRITTMVKNYMDSLKDIATDRPPSCQEPDIPGQGTRQRDQSLKEEPQGCEHMREITHKMFNTSYNTCNSCNHDLPPQAVEYTEMDEVPFTAYQDTTVRPGYQDTMVVSAVLPTEGLVLMEPEREKRPPLLAMPYAIGNMTSRYKNADLKKDTLVSKRRHMRVGQLQVRPEQICQIHKDSIQMNLMFNHGKVEIGWERPEEDERHQQDWDKQLETTISELHQETEEEPGIWVHDWNWTQTAERPTAHKYHIYEGETFYSEDETETDDVEVFYSDDEKDLGAVNEENSSDSEEEDKPQRKPEPRRSGRSWAPTQRALESQGQQWDFQRTGHREGFDTTLPRLPPERQPIDQEPEDNDPAPTEEQPIDAPPVGIGQEDLNLEPTPEGDLDDLVLEPAVDH